MFNLYAIHSTYYIQEVQVIVEHILFQSLDRKFSRGLDFVRRIVTIPGSVTQGSSTIVMALQFDLTARREKNLRVLKSIDENVIEIIEDSSHVALYQFDAQNTKWERLDVEGSLFITRSSQEPFYSLIVLNKKGTVQLFEAFCIIPVLYSSMQTTRTLYRAERFCA